MPNATATNLSDLPLIVDETNIEAVEDQTLTLVTQIIGSLEGALAIWDASKDKPQELEIRFSHYRNLHKELMLWASDLLKTRSKRVKLNFEQRLKHIDIFVGLCFKSKLQLELGGPDG